MCARHLNYRKELVLEETDSCNTGDGMEKEHVPKWDLEVHTGQERRCRGQSGLVLSSQSKPWKPGSLSFRIIMQSNRELRLETRVGWGGVGAGSDSTELLSQDRLG